MASEEGRGYLGRFAEISQRRRRKDATGQKPDYHKGTQALSVRVPEDLADKVRERAQARGQSISAYLLDLIQADIATGKPPGKP